MIAEKKLASHPASSISEELVINGNVQSKGDLHLKGHVQGDVQCHALLVAERAQINGNVTAEEVVIQGTVVGAVKAFGVVLQAKSYLEGDVLCHTLTIEQGAVFEGRSRIDTRASAS